MEKNTLQNGKRATFLQGFLQFLSELIQLLGFNHGVTLYGIGAFAAALLWSFLIAILGLLVYGRINPIAEFSLFGQTINYGSYLGEAVLYIIFLFITILLGSGWWQVFQRKKEEVKSIKVLLYESSSSDDQLKALEELSNSGELARGCLKGHTLTLDIAGYSWKEADLQDVVFHGGNLSGCSFIDTQLQGAKFIEVDLSDAIFSDTQLQGAEFTKVDLSNTTFSNAIFGDIEDNKWCTFDDCKLVASKFVGKMALGDVFQGANLTDSVFTGVTLIKPSSLEDAILNQVDFTNANLSELKMRSAQDTTTMIFNNSTILPYPSNNNDYKRKWDKILLKIKEKAIEELNQNPSELLWRQRLWNRFTGDSIEPSLLVGMEYEGSQINARIARYEYLIEEFEYTVNNAHIYATAYMPASIFTDAEDVSQKIADDYWAAHIKARRNGIQFTRIFIIDSENDLDQEVKIGKKNKTIKDLIIQQSKEITVAVVLHNWFQKGDYAAFIQGGLRDVVIFEDENDLRFYQLDGLKTSSTGSLIRNQESADAILKAFKQLLEQAKNENILYIDSGR